MAEKYQIEGQSRDVEFVGWDDATSLEQPDPVRVGVQGVDGSIWLRIGEKRQRVVVARGEGGAWVWHAGRARWVEDANGQRKQRKAKALPGAITPPMPATVVRIMVELGDEVEQGQGLVVVAAMKMETTLTAPHKGVVDAINTEVGATVKPGDILVDVKKEAEEAPEDEG